MQITQKPSIIKWPKRQQSQVLSLNRKSSLQIQRRTPESISKHARQSLLSSYPVFQKSQSKIMSPVLLDQSIEEGELERKKSSFLKNYNQKLKRQRKRQNKLKSSLNNLRLTRFDININQNANQTLNPRHSTQKLSTKKLIHKNPDNTEWSSKILVLKKTPFLDTCSNAFRVKKDYTADSSFQMLLKEIYQIKDEERRQIERIKKKEFSNLLEKENTLSKMPQSSSYFTKYDRGFSLPMKKKFLMNSSYKWKESDVNKTMNSNKQHRTSQSPLQKGSQSPLNKISQNPQEIEKLHKTLVLTEKQRYKHREDRLFNFKKIEPWENPSNRQSHHGLDMPFLYSQFH